MGVVMPKVHDWAQYYIYIKSCANKNGILSANALAEKADINPSLVSKIKTGDSKSPTFDSIYSICEAAGASIDVMCGLKCETTEEINNLQDEIEELRQQNNELAHKLEVMEVELRNKEERLVALRKIDKLRLKICLILGISLAIIVSAVIAILIIDKLNTDIGWFTAFKNFTHTLKNRI